MTENESHRFDRLPETAEDRRVEGRATRREVLDWWEERFGIPPSAFEGYTFWEKGAGKVWILHGSLESPTPIEALGLRALHTRQRYWKPTTNAAQRFGDLARKNVIRLEKDRAAAFVRGEEQPLEWDGDWGYVIATTEIGGERAPLGVGLYTHGELTSMIPKGRRRDLRDE